MSVLPDKRIEQIIDLLATSADKEGTIGYLGKIGLVCAALAIAAKTAFDCMIYSIKQSLNIEDKDNNEDK